MIGPDASAIELVIEAASDPTLVLQIAQGRILAARDIIRMQFDDFAAAQHVRETSAILVAVADALKDRSMAPVKRPGRKQVNAAKKAVEIDTAQAVLDAALGTWEAV